MAKQFKIYFSKSEEIVKETFDIDIGEESVSVKRLEIELLKVIFMISARFQTAIPDALECKDVVDQLKNISDSAAFIELTKKDIEYGKTGWIKSAGQRLYNWIDKGEAILSQLHTPFEPEKNVVWDDKANKFKEV